MAIGGIGRAVAAGVRYEQRLRYLRSYNLELHLRIVQARGRLSHAIRCTCWHLVMVQAVGLTDLHRLNCLKHQGGLW